MKRIRRRQALTLGLAGCALPRAAWAQTPREITWDDLIPPGIPYAEIIGEGELDEANDTWRPIYDANATKMNEDLHGSYIRMPGFVVPLELDADGVTEFLLVPYVGACIHTPPPPPNQLVLVQTSKPWPEDDLWAPVWVEGRMGIQIVSNELGDSGYTISAEHMEVYEW